jgi:thioredoxin-dependent peroxiredoxin
MASESKSKGLKVGDAAPSFSLKNTEGKTVKLSDYKGKKVVLYFYPRDMTPGCTKEACGFRDDFAQLKKRGVEV